MFVLADGAASRRPALDAPQDTCLDDDAVRKGLAFYFEGEEAQSTSSTSDDSDETTQSTLSSSETTSGAGTPHPASCSSDSLVSLRHAFERAMTLDDADHAADEEGDATATVSRCVAVSASHNFHLSHPSLMDRVFAEADHDALLVLRATCKEWKLKCDLGFMRHVVVRQEVKEGFEPWAGHLWPRDSPLISTKLYTPEGGHIPIDNPTRKVCRNAIRILDLPATVRSPRHLLFRLRFCKDVLVLRVGTFKIKRRRLPRCRVFVVDYEPADATVSRTWRRAREKVVVPIYNEMYPTFMTGRTARVEYPYLVVLVVNLDSLTWKQAGHPWFELCMVFYRITNLLCDTTRSTPVQLVGFHELVRARYKCDTLADAEDIVCEKLHEVMQMSTFNISDYDDRQAEIDRITFTTVAKYRSSVGAEQYAFEVEHSLQRQQALDSVLAMLPGPVALEDVLDLGHQQAGTTFR